ncbi:restriction endonuclease subunit S [Bacteroides sp.]|uniref:restriction endonuclease subunit S n=1 Tax=Bacteroides sp. TaxID=29523 RepID=UPI003AB2D2CA
MSNVELGEICNILNGFAFKSNNYVKEGIRVIRIANVQKGEIVDNDPQFYPVSTKKEIAKYILFENDLLISLTGNVGRVGILPKSLLPAALNQRVACLRIKNNNIVDEKYLFNILNSDYFEHQCILNSQGIAQKNMSTEWLKSFSIFLPNIERQREVAAVLDKASELIEKRKEQLRELDTLAESVFYDMFGDPVTNPKGWKKGQLGDVCKSVNYGTSSPANCNGRYKYLRMGNITYGGELDFSDLKHIDVSEKDFEKYVVRKGDILFNRTNSKELVGKTAYFNIDEEMIIAGYIIRVRINNSCSSVFVSKYLNTKYIKVHLRDLCKSIIGQANINAKELQSIPIYFPPLELQQQFATIIGKIEEQKAKVKESLKESEDLFQRLMQDMFNPQHYKK